MLLLLLTIALLIVYFALLRKSNHGTRCGLVHKALPYKPAGRGFDSRWCNWNFSVTNLSGRTMDLGSTQPLTEMSTRCISWWVKAAGG